jgi:hypothetical protein
MEVPFIVPKWQWRGREVITGVVEINSTVSELKLGKRRRCNVDSVGEIMKTGQSFVFFFHWVWEGGRRHRAATPSGPGDFGRLRRDSRKRVSTTKRNWAKSENGL